MSRRAALSALLGLLFLSACAAPQIAFLERSVVAGGRTYRYRVWLPPHFTRLRRWPVILFLHGSGERGTDNLRQLTIGLPATLRRSPASYRAVVVIPQCLPGQEWYGDMEQQALAALDQSIREFRGDRRRVYLTGISMGGAGVWYFARHPERFAAIVPVAGEVVRQPDDPFPVDPPRDLARLLDSRDPYAALAGAIGRLPVWAFHGGNDAVIPVSQSRAMVHALRMLDGSVRFTEYEGAGHDVWDRAYGDPALARWLLLQRRTR